MICRLSAESRERGEKIYCWVEVLRKSGADRASAPGVVNYGQVAATILTADTSSVRALLADEPAALRPAASGLVAPAAPDVAPGAPLVAPELEDAAAGLPVTCTR
jgi:hypothetical protein